MMSMVVYKGKGMDGYAGGGDCGGVSPPAARTALLALFLSQFLNQPTLKHQE